MLINKEKNKIDYLTQYGLLHENNTFILLDDTKIDSKIKQIKEKYRNKRIQLKKRRSEDEKKIKDFAKDVGEDVSKDMLKAVDKKVKSKFKRIVNLYLAKMVMLGKEESERIKRIEKIKSMSRKSIFLTSGLALASILIKTSYDIYKDEENNIERICSTKKSSDKELCIKRNRIKALKKRIDFLNNSSFKCNQSKDPVKCKDKLDEEILRVREMLRDEITSFGRKLKIKF